MQLQLYFLQLLQFCDFNLVTKSKCLLSGIILVRGQLPREQVMLTHFVATCRETVTSYSDVIVNVSCLTVGHFFQNGQFLAVPL